MDDGPRRVSWDVTDGVAHVRLDRPEKLNALDSAMFEALVATGSELVDHEDVGAVVLSGEGRAFCAGLDFGEFAAMRDRPGSRVDAPRSRLGAARTRGQQAAHVWSLVPAPVVAAVHGVAFGGGLQIALGADIRIVAPDARLSVMEIRWGIVPDMTGTQVLPELVGRDVAKELALTGREVTGEEAVALGLATRQAADPLAAALALAHEIAGHSRRATRHVKRLMDLAGRVGLAEGLQAEQDAIGELIGSPEQVAVVERRLAGR
ncbi:crotonase/enoyl-CoA hydratase family protein [Geodermatophilus sabuli]|uniref:Enoyl-CoA hydratase/carnithine racemase n=1 Tax=Geodermatophilus sabuli TaxID=1564158 RepID=A0A285EAX1_9ACTN|nr:crotonase/enoyl-CoA hydratase family protein [Geodermatophilus sabuli]MBB3085576.1 enoyl-CoA hydratase/carnithine racemase [Geodermatophilus sabuli]SNX96003.1 Enoyl-CoA hydratase/carnithine racemase [Geodermatophilus sabuli]